MTTSGGVRHLLGAVGLRVLIFALTLAGAVAVMTALLSLAMGNAADQLGLDPVQAAAYEQAVGLDLPWALRWLGFMADAARGDLGESLTYRPGASVAGLVWTGVRTSAPILVGALVASMGLGIAGAWGRQRAGRRLIQALSVAPVFLLASAAVEWINETTFGLIQAGTIARPDWFALPIGDSALKWALAVGILAVGSSALTEVHAGSRAELRRILDSGYIDAARARGARLWPHVLSNLIPPMASLAARRTALFLGGLVVIEKVLQLQGAGAMLWQACRMRDYPLVLGLTLVAAAVVCAARLTADLVRVAVDPRLRT